MFFNALHALFGSLSCLYLPILRNKMQGNVRNTDVLWVK